VVYGIYLFKLRKKGAIVKEKTGSETEILLN